MRGDAAAPRASPAPNASKASRKGLWLLVLGVVALGGIGTLFLLTRDSTPAGRDYAEAIPAHSANRPALTTSAAILVEDNERENPAYNDPLGMIAKNAEQAPAGGPAPPVAGTAPGLRPSTSATANAGPRSRRAPSPSGRAANSPAAAGEDSDLLATLLTNIKDYPSRTPPPPAEPQTLDTLIDQLLAQDAQNTTAAKPVNQGSAKLQTSLRNCPPANTLEGVNCRQKICASYTGNDPACPKQ